MSYDPADVTKYLDQAQYPATGRRLAGVAAVKIAPFEMLKALNSFDEELFESPPDVVRALRQHSG